MADRGNKSIVGEDMSRWLNSKDPKSVIYICFGSVSDMKLSNLREIGLGLEASNYNFIWVVKLGKNSQEMEKWFEEFEERVKGRGLVIKGWASQVLALSHPSIGAFFTHCGWNSTLEGICAGVPMATWPMFAEQFFNERMIVDILQIGVSLGVKEATRWGREEKVRGVIRREDVKKALERVMDGGVEGEERRTRAKELAEAAKRAMEDDGSSNMNMDLFIQNAMSYAQKKSDEVIKAF